MTSLPNFPRLTLTNLKHRRTNDGGYASAICHLDGKKIATFHDSGDGAPSQVEFVSPEAKDALILAADECQFRQHLHKNQCSFYKSPEHIDADSVIALYVSEAVNASEYERHLKKIQKKTDSALVAENGQMMVWKKGITLAQVAKSNLAILQTTYDKFLASLPNGVKVMNTSASLQSMGVNVQPQFHIQ